MADTPAIASDGLGAASRHAFVGRALNATPAYWLSMFAASALGTNLGDFWVGELSFGRGMSFASLAALSVLAIWTDRNDGRRGEAAFWVSRGEAAFWVAIVALRAAATNLGDFLTHDLAFGFVTVTIVLGVATLVAGAFTRIDPAKGNSPTIDIRYWVAMLIAGVFGTVGGDLAAHWMGLAAAAFALGGLLVLLIALRDRFAPVSVIAYWCVVLAERSAGTPAGDALASHRAAGLGLPMAMACTGGLLLAGLLAHGLSRKPAWR